MFFSEYVIYMITDNDLMRVCNFNKEIADGKYQYSKYSWIPNEEKDQLKFKMQGIIGEVARLKKEIVIVDC